MAEKIGFGEEDLNLLWDALINMFEHDRSADRGVMSSRKLFVFRHDNKLGNAPAHQLFDLIHIERNQSSQGSARAFTNYDVIVNEGAIPQGVELLELLYATRSSTLTSFSSRSPRLILTRSVS